MAAKKKSILKDPIVWVGAAAVVYFLVQKKNNAIATQTALPLDATTGTTAGTTTTKAQVAKKKKTVKETIAGYLPSWLGGGSVDYGY